MTLAVLAASTVAMAVLARVAIYDGAGASPTTTAAATAGGAAATSTTRPASTTSRPAAGTTAVPTTTEAGPAPRGSRRVAAAVDIEKIRPTSLPVQTLVITTAVVIAALAIAGFVYGKVRSRPPGAPTATSGRRRRADSCDRRDAGRLAAARGTTTDSAPPAADAAAPTAGSGERVGPAEGLRQGLLGPRGPTLEPNAPPDASIVVGVV